jgi:hypothetical protein
VSSWRERARESMEKTRAANGSAMNDLTCPRCGREKKAFFALCWRCKTADEMRAAHEMGFASGLAAGIKKGGQAQLDATRLRQLLQLCHPDKHNGSRTAVEVTQWLLSQRK